MQERSLWCLETAYKAWIWGRRGGVSTRLHRYCRCSSPPLPPPPCLLLLLLPLPQPMSLDNYIQQLFAIAQHPSSVGRVIHDQGSHNTSTRSLPHKPAIKPARLPHLHIALLMYLLLMYILYVLYVLYSNLCISLRLPNSTWRLLYNYKLSRSIKQHVDVNV